MASFLKKRWYVLIILSLLAGLWYFRFSPVSGQNKKDVPYQVKKQDLKDTLSLSGKIDAEEKVTLRFQTSGRLAWVGVKEGDLVKKFQSVASLDQREVKKKLDKYLNDYLDTRWKFEQTKDDNKDKVVTTAIQRVLDESQFGLNKSVLDVEIQSLTVEFANLWTPIGGIVTKVGSPFAGVNITPSQAEFEIVNPKSVYFSATADQTDVVKLNSLKNAEITFDSYPDSVVLGAIKSISFVPKTNETGTVYEVKITLPVDNSNYQYRLGMTGDVSFVIKEKSGVIAVPTRFIGSEKDQRYVWKKENGAKKKVFVAVGEEFEEMVEIKNGLKDGDTIY